MFRKNKEITCSCIIPELDLYLYCILNTSTDKKLKENNMHSWFECKVSFEKVLENGMQKKVTEPYLVDALSFTEAEARIIEEIRPFISSEFTVTDIKRARIPNCSSRWRTSIVRPASSTMNTDCPRS